MNQIILELVNHGFQVTILIKDGSITYRIEGFYKSKYIELRIDQSDQMIATARYGGETKINSFQDLVRLNYDWWQRSKDRAKCWNYPDAAWAKYMLKYGLYLF